MFAVSFDEIAPIVGRSAGGGAATCKPARARRVQGADAVSRGRSRRASAKIVDAFLAASRGGDFEALLEVLDPEVVFRADDAAVRPGWPAEIRGARAVAQTFKGRAIGARPAVVDGGMGLVVVMQGKLRVVVSLTI